MSGMSAANAKKVVKKPTKRVFADVVYTIAGKQYTFAEVMALVRKHDTTAVVTEKRVKARLDRGHRTIAVLAADKLPNFRPTGLRGRTR